MRNRWLWLLSGTALAFSLLSTGYLCLTGREIQAETTLASAGWAGQGELSSGTAPSADGGCVVKSIEGEICVIEEGAVRRTGLADSLLPTRDQQALAAGIEVEDEEALAALLEDLGS